MSKSKDIKNVGVNFFGYVNGAFGVGRAARLVADAMKHGGVPYALYNIVSAHHEIEADVLIEAVSEYPFRVNYLHFNADTTTRVSQIINPQYFQGKYNIAHWAWELSNFPDAWNSAIEFVDEIWVPSEFILEALKKKTNKPIRVMHYPIPKVTAGYSRKHFGIPADSMCCLVTFDLQSYMDRKNPIAAIRSFQRAFLGKENVCLIVKLQSGGVKFEHERKKLMSQVEGDSRIIVIDKVLSRGEMESLQSCCDVYISLHRSEGFGLNLAECMGQGKVVVATSYSGNVDFMDAQSACLVPYELTPLLDGQYPYWEGQVWAEPSLEAAAVFLKKLYDDSGYRKKIGKAAEDRVATQLSAKVIGSRIKSRLMEIEEMLG